MLSSTHCAAPATRAIDTCLLPADGDSSDATVVLPYAAAVMACACDAVTPTDVIACSVPRTGTATFGAVVRLLGATAGRRTDKDTVKEALRLTAVDNSVVAVPPAECPRVAAVVVRLTSLRDGVKRSVRVFVWCGGATPRSPSPPLTSGRATSPKRRRRLPLLAALDRAVRAAWGKAAALSVEGVQQVDVAAHWATSDVST